MDSIVFTLTSLRQNVMRFDNPYFSCAGDLQSQLTVTALYLRKKSLFSFVYGVITTVCCYL